MFDYLFKRFKKEEPKIVLTISNDLLHVIKNGDINKEFKGVDSSKCALISVKRNSDGTIAVGIEFERNSGSDIFSEVHRTICDSQDSAVEFFKHYGIINNLKWLDGFKPKISLLKRPVLTRC